MLYRWAFSLLTLVVLLSVVSAAIAQEKLRLAWAGFSPTNSPIWVMEDRKLLQKQGVDPKLSRSTRVPTVLASLAGQRNRSGQYLRDHVDEFPSRPAPTR